MTDIHSCSYFCERPACVLAQRNELRDKLMEQNNSKHMEVLRSFQKECNSGLRDQFACAAMGGTLSAKSWHPDYIIPAGGGHVGGQRAADAAAESAYKYADAMMKAREK